ncbi:MAG: dihydroneopterin aldolase [Gemmatimonadetes bacterium]|nr:MAG: dihydroneopterin aldolase [Gemmatimonadota bacterium]
MDKITLKGMRFYGYHGVYEVEREMGQFFEVDVELYGDFRQAAISDDLADTIDYGAIYETTQHAITTHKYKLLEAVAEHIAGDIMAGHDVSKVCVRVRKKTVPVLGYLDYVEAEITRER